MKNQLSLKNMLPKSHILWQVPYSSKKRVFEQVSLFLEDTHGFVRNQLFRQFISRERLGSTFIGNHGAIPHIRADIVKEPLCVLVRLSQPVPYNGDDKVQTLFFLIVPEKANEDHLCLLAIFSHMLTDEQLMTQFENCDAAHLAYEHIIAWETKHTNTLNAIFNPPLTPKN